MSNHYYRVLCNLLNETIDISRVPCPNKRERADTLRETAENVAKGRFDQFEYAPTLPAARKLALKYLDHEISLARERIRYARALKGTLK